jgi:hydrogenase maturation protease
MSPCVLIAGIGNIFQGDDAFGVAVAQRLATMALPESVRVMDAGIRGIDLCFALLDGFDLTILVDATARGGAPGTLYTIAIEPGDVPDLPEEASMANSHGLNPVSVLALAKRMGAQLKNVLLIGCEPLVVEHEESGYIGLSDPVGGAVNSAVETIVQILEKHGVIKSKEEVFSHECL